MSQDAIPANDFASLGPGAVSVVHFCQARRDETLDPLGFVRSMALSLSQHQPFAEALMRIGDQNIVVTSNVAVGHVDADAHVHGIHIETLNIGAISARVAFNRVIRQPLQALCKAQPEIRLLLLVDGLDEALTLGAEESIVSLLGDVTSEKYGLPAQERFLLTSRPEPRVLAEFPRPALDLEGDLPSDDTDLQDFVASCFPDLDE